MAVYKRGKVWWFKFAFNGEQCRESTKQTNKRVAEQIEAARKTGLAKGDVGIRDRAPVQHFEAFAKADFLPHVASRFADKPGTLAYYRTQVSHLLAFSPIANAKLDAISAEAITGFIEKRRQAKYEVATINRSLQVLRRMFRLGVEWGKIDKTPTRITLLPGERRRERVLSHQEETEYLNAAREIGEAAIAAYERALHGIRAVKRNRPPTKPADPFLLRDAATVLLDCGLRPDECYRLRWDEYREGNLHIARGKTANARRTVPLSDRGAALLEMATGDNGRRLDLSRPNAKRTYRAFKPEETACEGLQVGEVRTRSVVHVPPYLPDAVGGVHGPLFPRILRGAQFVRDDTPVCSPESCNGARSNGQGTNGTGWAQKWAQ